MQRTGRWPALLVLTAAVLLVGGCGLSNDLRATIGLPTSESESARADARAAVRASAMPDGPGPGRHQMMVTARQRGYLDALGAAGVTPSSDLLALSIGSYVCQARAAHQNDQAVRDFVVPLVRSDARSTRAGDTAGTATPPDIDTRTSDYIRIATERLC